MKHLPPKLEKGSKKYRCPECGEKTLTKYVSQQTGEYISDEVGRCDREANCGYHYPPKQYFIDNPNSKKDMISGKPGPPDSIRRPNIVYPASLIDDALVMASFAQSAYLQNAFVLFLVDRFGPANAELLVKKYRIGNSKKWNGAVVFWQIDKDEKVRTGKVMLYDRATGKRIKKPFNHIHWVHSILKLENFNLKQCFFGEHLLAEEPEDKPVAVVESEKTAMIASLYFPDFIWMACGGLSYLSNERFDALHGRKIILFPDLNGLEKWQEKAKGIHGAIVSDLLESVATDEERQSGLDLADYLLRFSLSEWLEEDKPESGTCTLPDGTVLNWQHVSPRLDPAKASELPPYPEDWDLVETLNIVAA